MVPQQRPPAHRRPHRDGRRRPRLLLGRPRRGKDALLICDTWEMADALNRRLHDTLTAGPLRTLRATSHPRRRPIMSRNNDVTIDVHPGPGRRPGERVDQVRNGNRWRVAAIDATPTALPPNDSPTTPAWSSTATTSASTSLWATPRPCTPPKASPPTPPTPSWVRAHRGPCLCRDDPRPGQQRGVHLPAFSQEADHEHANPVSATLSTCRAAVINTLPRTTSG